MTTAPEHRHPDWDDFAQAILTSDLPIAHRVTKLLAALREARLTGIQDERAWASFRAAQAPQLPADEVFRPRIVLSREGISAALLGDDAPQERMTWETLDRLRAEYDLPR